MANPDLAVWVDVLSFLREHHPTICRQWFEEIEPIGTHDGAYRLRVRQQVHQRYLSRQCVDPFVEALQSVTGHLVTVRFVGPDEVVPEPSSNGSAHKQRNGQLTATASRTEDATIEAKPARRSGWQPVEARDFSNPEGPNINPDHTFNDYVVGQENRFAVAAAKAVADNPGKAYNPLFIHGGLGLGKTHLLHAICVQVLDQNPKARIFYISCEDFSRTMLDAVENGKLQEFSDYYRHLDMLLIDDVHFLTKRDRSQEEFFHTFNALQQAGKQIVLSCDAPPSEIPDLEQRLVSRFQSGLVVPINPPCFETRVQIAHRKARMLGMELPEEVACFIAKRVQSSPRELGGRINQLHMLHHFEKMPLTEETAQLALGAGATELTREITIDDIIQVVSQHYAVKLSDLQGKRRQKSIALPRQVCMYLIRKICRYSLEEVGGYFGGRDHTTVMHAEKTIRTKYQNDPELARVIQALRVQLGLPPEESDDKPPRSPFSRTKAPD